MATQAQPENQEETPKRHGPEGFLATGEAPVSLEEVEKTAFEQTLLWAYRFESRHQREIIAQKGIGARGRDVLAGRLFPDDAGFARAWASSLDSALGKLYQEISGQITRKRFDMGTHFSGPIYQWQILAINRLLEEYTTRDEEGERRVSSADVKRLDPSPRKSAGEVQYETAEVEVDKYIRAEGQGHILIEEKASADLDKGKSQETKRALLRAYAVLRNKHRDEPIRIFMSAAYDKDHATDSGEWKQDRVRSVFARDELLIGPEFWNTMAGQTGAYEAVQRGLARAEVPVSGMRERLRGLYAECLDDDARARYLSGEKQPYTPPTSAALDEAGVDWKNAEKRPRKSSVRRAQRACAAIRAVARKPSSDSRQLQLLESGSAKTARARRR